MEVPAVPQPITPVRHRKTFLILALVVAAFFCFIALIVLWVSNKPKTESKLQSSSSAKVINTVRKGVSFSPKSLDATGFLDFYSKLGDTGSLVTWGGDWQELASTRTFPNNFVNDSKTYNFTPVIIASLYNQGAKSLLRPLSQENLAGYKKAATDFATIYKPAYLGLGSEVNIMAEDDPSDFETFVTLFKDTVEAVKQASPQTKVFTVFQLERIKGLKGGLFGGVSDTNKNNWDLLAKFSEADFFAFTSYPYLIYKDPKDIPSDYYSSIKTQTNKKVAFVEVGWPSAAVATGYESSEAKQAEFIDTFANGIKNLDKIMVIWPFVYDPATKAPFNNIGLITSDGHKKTAWEKWVNINFN